LLCPYHLLLVFVFVCSPSISAFHDIRFMERPEGQSVVLPCAVDKRKPAPFGVYLKRRWLEPRTVLFKHTGTEFTLGNNTDKNRISVSGDPSLHWLNVSVAELRAADTDRYYCQFVVENNSSEDEHVEGSTEFFLLVTAGECFFFFFLNLVLHVSLQMVMSGSRTHDRCIRKLQPLLIRIRFIARYNSHNTRNLFWWIGSQKNTPTTINIQ
uniref:Ig-like domain-containing protein n=1 Tax=Stegastes partitus TaxID=144197 RepID=A0A3B5B4U4_9TELE